MYERRVDVEWNNFSAALKVRIREYKGGKLFNDEFTNIPMERANQLNLTGNGVYEFFDFLINKQGMSLAEAKFVFMNGQQTLDTEVDDIYNDLKQEVKNGNRSVPKSRKV